MHKRKLLIAEGSEELSNALCDLFRGSCQVSVCADGDSARQQLSCFCPDVLVLDLMLPGYDGLSLLQWAREQGIRTQVLATTRFCSDYVVETAQELGVRYLIRKPCRISAVASRISDMLRRIAQTENPVAPGAELRGAMLALGVPGKLRGSTYLRCAIPLYAKDPLQSVTKVLYPEVAKHCGCAPSHVERSIRSAIEAAWKHRDETVWRLYFPTDEIGVVKKPTNTEFIARLAQSLERPERIPKGPEIEQKIPKTGSNVREEWQ